MKFSTKAVEKMAEIMVQEMNKIGAEGGEGIREMETRMPEFLREVGAQALGKYLEQQDEQLRKGEVICECGEAMTYECKRPAVIVSVFGQVRYRRGYHLCEDCHARQSPLERRMGMQAGQVIAGPAELLALAGVEVAFDEGTRWLERFGELQQAEEVVWQQSSQEVSWLQARQRTLGQQAGRLYGSLERVMHFTRPERWIGRRPAT